MRRHVLLLAFAAFSPAFLAAQKPPNLLVIQTDEHNFRTLGCYGGEMVETPNIDRLATEGVKCTSFYATTPVCSPSRAALVTGRYPQNTPVETNNIPLADGMVTFAEILRRRGYATGYAGKWHLDGTGKPQWAPKRKFGFEDNRFMFNRGHWKKLVDGADGPEVGGRNKRGKPSYALAGADSKTFTTDWLVDKTIAFIDKHEDGPFCYMVAIPDPHGPNTVRAPYDAMYRDAKLKIPRTIRKTKAQTPNWAKTAREVTPFKLRQLMPSYYGMVKCVDDNVGRILKTLEGHGILDDTIVVFTSDHGDLCGEHKRLNKGVPYEGSAKIPFLVRYPKKIPGGTVVHEALGCVDFMPSVLTLMGVPAAETAEGRDASDLLTGHDVEDWTDIAFIRGTKSQKWLCAVTNRFKLVYSPQDRPWLFDLKLDPDELNNYFDSPDHREDVQILTRALREYCAEHGDWYGSVPTVKAQMAAALAAPTRPNVVVILADDLGYGDVRTLNPKSRIPTPNLDRLAAQGMAFTDAHSPCAVCTPTRYGLLCGRYPWRSRLKRGVLGGYSPPLIERERPTIGDLLQDAGYHTACVGKWHLGIGWAWHGSKAPAGANRIGHVAGKGSIDYGKPISHGPLDLGFDHGYIIPASLDMSPYVWVRNRRVVTAPSRIIEARKFPAYWRRAEIAEDFVHVDVLDHLLARSQEYIRSRKAREPPFFLYFPLTAPHKPVLPHPRFRGKTALGDYGDFITQVDWTVGQVMKTLDETGVADNTLVMVTSDNGSFMHRYPNGDKNHPDDSTVQGFHPDTHTANGIWRGTKADIWEAGHRVPFFARWPGQIEAGSRNASAICLTDILATCAEIVGKPFDRASARDSHSFLAALRNRVSAERPPIIHQSANGSLSIREGRWKLLLCNGSGGRERPRGKPFGKPFQLYDLDADPSERTDLAGEQADVVARLTAAAKKIIGRDVTWRD